MVRRVCQGKTGNDRVRRMARLKERKGVDEEPGVVSALDVSGKVVTPQPPPLPSWVSPASREGEPGCEGMRFIPKKPTPSSDGTLQNPPGACS